MKSGIQYAVNACQNDLGRFSNRVLNIPISWVPIGSLFIWNTIGANGDEKSLSQMFCDDKDSQENAKQIQNQWDKLSESDKVRAEIKHYIYNIFKVTFELVCWDQLSTGVDGQFVIFLIDWIF